MYADDDPFVQAMMQAMLEPVPAHSLKGVAGTAGLFYIPGELAPQAAAWDAFVHGG